MSLKYHHAYGIIVKHYCTLGINQIILTDQYRKVKKDNMDFINL